MHVLCKARTVSVFLILMLLGLAVTRAAAQAPWPNLDILQNYPKPGTSCSLRGTAPTGSEKAASNSLKNRYRLPATSFEPLLLSDIIGLPSGTPAVQPTSADANNHDPSGKGMVVVEVQERIRRVATKGLLQSNIGKNWSTPMLRAKLLGRWVKFSGWLFYDADHHLESWQVDKDNTMDGANWRETGWEVHPVMAIQSGVTPPSDAVR